MGESEEKDESAKYKMTKGYIAAMIIVIVSMFIVCFYIIDLFFHKEIATLSFILFLALAIAFVFCLNYLLLMRSKIGMLSEMEEEREKAIAENESKSGFLASMSHEIRTPINAVLGIDEMILREFDDPKLLQYANNMKDAGNTLLNIINDILDYSKMESGSLSLSEADYDLTDMLREIVVIIRPRIEKKGLDFEMNIDNDTPHLLHGDNIRLKQCLINILTNAAKYTERGRISFTINFEKKSENEGLFEFSVQDTGIGIKEENIPLLTKPFERFDQPKNRSIEGTGLGLSITSELLNLMDSALEVESIYGEGSNFHFKVKQGIVDSEPIGDFRKALEERSEIIPVYHSSFKAKDTRILVVDDTELNLFVVQGLLKETGVTVDTEISGEQGLADLALREYDVLLIDDKMPGMDGIEMLHALRSLKDNVNSRKPCIALTANAFQGAREYYISKGFEDYLSKPIDSSALEKMLIKYLPKEKIDDKVGADIKDKRLLDAVKLLKNRESKYLFD